MADETKTKTDGPSLLEQLMAGARGDAPFPGYDGDDFESREPVNPGYAAYLEAFAAEEAAAPRCKRCGGTGHLKGYEHVAGGVCFACGGEPYRAAEPMTEAEWSKSEARRLGLDGFAVFMERPL